jgi:hypothetical protein
VVVIKIGFHIAFSKTGKKEKSKSEIAPDFPAIFGYFGWILAAQKYTTLSKVCQGDVRHFF